MSSGFILVWTEKEKNYHTGSEKLTDHYEYYATKKNANTAYKRLLDIDDVYSASICNVVESTDYEEQLQ